MKKPVARFVKQHGGGSYRLEILLVENAREEQNAWADAQGMIVYDHQLSGVKTDLRKSGFRIVFT